MRTLHAIAAVGCLLLMPLAAFAKCPELDGAAAYFAAASRLRAAEQMEDAVECQRLALAQSAPSLETVRQRVVLAQLLESSGQLPESVAELQQALPEMERFAGETGEETADLLRKLGWLEYITGSLDQADAHLLRAHEIYLARLGPRHTKIAKTLNSLGVVQRDQGRYEQAQSTFATAFEIAANGPTPDDDMRAVIYNNVAGLWYYRGDYRRAVENYRSALPIFERLYGESSIDVGITVNNLGSMYEELGDYESARDYYTRALAIQEKLLGPAHPSVGAPVNNLAVLEHSMGNTRAAGPLFERALSLYETGFGAEHPNVAEVLVKYAALEHELGENERARKHLERALAIQRQSFGPDSSWTATSLNQLGPVYQALGERARAKQVMVQAIGVAAASAEQQVLMTAYANYADVLANQGELQGAAFYGKFAVNLAQQMRQDVSALGQSVQKSFLAKRQPIYRALADRLIALGRLAEAEQVMTMLKEEEFFDFVRTAISTQDGGVTRADFSSLERPYADRVAAASVQLAASARSLRTADDRLKDVRRQAVVDDQSALREALEQSSAALARRIERARPESATTMHRSVPTATALVRYLVTEQRLRAIVSTPSRSGDVVVDLDIQELNRLIFELRSAVQNPRSDVQPPAQALYRLLIAPLQPLIEQPEGIDRLQFELDGALRYVPFAALHDGERFLLEHYSVEQRTAAGPKRRDNAQPSHDRLAGFGVTKAVGGFPELPSVGTELDRIVRRHEADRGVVPGVIVMDEAFTEDRLREGLAADYSLVHIATHFVFRPGPLSDSFLLLGSGRPLTLERLRDGRFSLANVRLLTLSACSTAIGDTGTGGELESFGVLAQRLGARQVLATLWPVADRSTSRLMFNLYRTMDRDGALAAQALRDAQLDLLRGEPRFKPYSHPFYWAPFILMSSAGE